jgi:Trk-type K+ transport system membrane component
MSIISSVIFYGARNLDYIDCLFFSVGGATQSGLNTVNVNDIYTYQQITVITLASLCNPMVINTFVVFVRLYWFEKRFQHVARQANEFRRNRTRSRSKTDEKRDPDFDREERGVGNRQINVLLNDTGHKENGQEKDAIAGESERRASLSPGSSSDAAANGMSDAKKAGDGKDESASPRGLELPSPLQRDIIRVDQVQRQTQDILNEDRILEQRTTEQHIVFVEDQPHPKETGALRIPGPREWDRGDLPRRVEEGERDGDLSPQASAYSPSEINIETKKRESLRRRVRNILSTALKSPTPEDSSGPALNASRSTRSRSRSIADPMPYLSYAPTIGRNSLFVDLTEEQREELGGIEYRSLRTLARVLILYFFCWSAFGIILFEPWILNSPYYKDIIRSNGQGVPWWGFFTAMSAFTDLGFTLTSDSMLSFNTAVLPLLVGAFLIVIGNTGFPCMLRFIIWLGSFLAPYGSSVWEEFRFLLDHPRRCFTLLFPRKATWWLFGILVILNGIDIIFYIILDLKDPVVTSVSGGYQFLDGLFQAASTRTAGFSVVNLAALHPATQVSYLIMMYISVFPIAISVRQTNVYEENSLGIYARQPDLAKEDSHDSAQKSYLGSHLRRQLSFDLWYVFLGLFFICIIEGDRIQDPNDPGFTIFACLFEIVSAYGTVGLSLGYPGVDTSFSAEFRVLSKLIIVAMMLRGRHRGLPYALDRAILLPNESLERKERENAERRRRYEELRRQSAVSASGRDEMDNLAAVASGAAGQDVGTLSPPPAQGSGSRRQSAVTVDSETGRSVTRPRVPVQALAKVISGVLSAGPGYSGKKSA